jgi:two-component system LytT family response regulator
MSAKRPLRVLIVDDEPLGIERVRALLDEQPDVEIVGTPEDGAAAVEAIRILEPDLVFLDIQMPRKTGLDVVREVGPARMPATIFVTAYDQYALRAFDVAAVDYLFKPYDDERFEEAFHRARRRIELEWITRLRDQMLVFLQGDPYAELHVGGDRLPDPRVDAGPGGAARPRPVHADPSVDHRLAGPRRDAAARVGWRLRGPAQRGKAAAGGEVPPRGAGAPARAAVEQAHRRLVRDGCGRRVHLVVAASRL